MLKVEEDIINFNSLLNQLKTETTFTNNENISLNNEQFRILIKIAVSISANLLSSTKENLYLAKQRGVTEQQVKLVILLILLIIGNSELKKMVNLVTEVFKAN